MRFQKIELKKGIKVNNIFTPYITLSSFTTMSTIIDTNTIPTSVNRREIEYKEMKFVILNSDTHTSNDTTPEDGLYRSVIMDDNNKLLCVAPFGSKNLQDFMSEHPCVKSSEYLVTPVIEGTMLNVFYDSRLGSWIMTTRKVIGANNTFYQSSTEKHENPTFYQMFCETLGISDTTLDTFPLFANSPKDYVYSFVLQHPLNHIVLNLEDPALYLVQVLRIEGNNVENIELESMKETLISYNTCIIVPYVYDSDYDEMYEMFKTRDTFPGFMVTHKNSNVRTCVENPKYMYLKELRGNNPNLLYHYFALMKINRIQEFLHYFPKYIKMFNEFSKQCAHFVKHIHDSYILYYIQKRGKEVQIPKHIFSHICKLHLNIYLPSKATETPIIITKKVVKDYFDNMLPKEQFYYLMSSLKP